MGEKSSAITIIETESGTEENSIIYLPSALVEESVIQQLQTVAKNNSVSHIRLMPDCHEGHGCLVGFTAEIHPLKINPNFIGGDIGCGILTYKLGKKKLDLYKVEEKVRRLVPMGTALHDQIPIEDSFLARYLEKANQRAMIFLDKVATIFATEVIMQDFIPPTINMDYFLHVCAKIDIPVPSALKSFGTLGSGNHFIEINEDSSSRDHDRYLTIHSGSRHFGMKLFHHHCSYLDPIEKCLVGQPAFTYIFDMILAQELAIMNRHIMLQLILRELNLSFCEEEIIESIHNYIDFDRMILRKGAIRAEKHELCIVALNMRDGIVICEGLGASEWNYSCAHGCGRQFSRSEAKRCISMKEFKKSMQEVVTTAVRMETLDEAPMAYKDHQVILDAIHEKTVLVQKVLTPLINWKGIE